MKTIFKLFIFTLLFTANTFAQETTWKTHTTDAYEVMFPSGWDFNNSEGMIMDFLALCPLESDDDKLRENINLVKENAQNLSIDEYFASSKKMLEKTFQELEIISSEDVDRNGITMKRFTYTANFGGEYLYFSQQYGILNNVAYVLTFTSEKANFENFVDLEETIFKSFRLTGK